MQRCKQAGPKYSVSWWLWYWTKIAGSVQALGGLWSAFFFFFFFNRGELLFVDSVCTAVFQFSSRGRGLLAFTTFATARRNIDTRNRQGLWLFFFRTEKKFFDATVSRAACVPDSLHLCNSSLLRDRMMCSELLSVVQLSITFLRQSIFAYRRTTCARSLAFIARDFFFGLCFFSPNRKVVADLVFRVVQTFRTGRTLGAVFFVEHEEFVLSLLHFHAFAVKSTHVRTRGRKQLQPPRKECGAATAHVLAARPATNSSHSTEKRMRSCYLFVAPFFTKFTIQISQVTNKPAQFEAVTRL